MLSKILKFIKNYLNKSSQNRLIQNGNLSVGNNSDLNGLKLEIKLGKKDVQNIKIGDGCMIFGNFYIERSEAKITVGNDTFLGGSSFIAAEEIEIGNNVMFSWGCTVIDTNAHSLNHNLRRNDVQQWKASIDKGTPGSLKNWGDIESKKIIIKDNAWIGFNSIILKGVTIGEGAVVAAGSVITKDVEDFTLVGGNPAKQIKKLAN